MSGFGERLRKLRRDKDMTQGQLGAYLGIQGAAVAKWENIENSYPTVETLIKVADYFDVTTDYLLKGTQTTPVLSGNIEGSTLNGSVVQNNVHSNFHNGIVFNGQIFSKEALKIAQIYDTSDDLRGKNELLTSAFKLEDEMNMENSK